jgi:hypothetical protein
LERFFVWENVWGKIYKKFFFWIFKRNFLNKILKKISFEFLKIFLLKNFYHFSLEKNLIKYQHKNSPKLFPQINFKFQTSRTFLSLIIRLEKGWKRKWLISFQHAILTCLHDPLRILFSLLSSASLTLDYVRERKKDKLSGGLKAMDVLSCFGKFNMKICEQKFKRDCFYINFTETPI